MTGPDAATTALRDKVAIALHDNDCGDRHCTPTVMAAYYRQADTAIALIRQRAAELIDQYENDGEYREPEMRAFVADLLDGAS